MDLIELILMTLGIVNIISCLTFKLTVIKKELIVIIELVRDKLFLSILNKHQCNCLQCVGS